jgi:hypothetical protein
MLSTRLVTDSLGLMDRRYGRLTRCGQAALAGEWRARLGLDAILVPLRGPDLLLQSNR